MVASLMLLSLGANAKCATTTVHPQIIVDNTNAMYQVGTANVLTGLSATCPDGPPSTEVGIVGPTWTWTVGPAQYSPLASQAFGSLPVNDGSKWGFDPSQFAKTQQDVGTSTVMLYTLLQTAGYWQFQVGVSVNWHTEDGSQVWSGNAATVEVGSPTPPNGGSTSQAAAISNSSSGSPNPNSPQETSWKLDINYGGAIVNNKTQDVSVGEQIPLTATYGPSDMTLQWTVPGSIIANYTANNQTGTITKVASMTPAKLNYYWMDTDTGKTANENVTLTGKLPAGKSPPAVNTTFNVYRPVPTFNTKYKGAISLVGGGLYDGLEPGGGGKDPGIEFDYSIPPAKFGGTNNLHTVQIADLLTVTTQQLNTATNQLTTFEFTLPSGNLPGPLLDTQFPYGRTGLGVTDDSPDYPVDPPAAGTGFGAGIIWQTRNVIVSETLTHNLLFLPIVPAGIATAYAPLSYVAWGWSAEADNPNNGGFILANSAKFPISPPKGVDLATLPIWKNNAADPISGWKNPQWFKVP